VSLAADWLLWQDEALCRGHEHPELWFPKNHGGSARSICATCPVRADCLAFALDQGADIAGVWGATAEHERRLLRREWHRLVKAGTDRLLALHSVVAHADELLAGRRSR
jgi:WhiB family transcriptional regulator, redox-sensing transcriptional regulator